MNRSEIKSAIYKKTGGRVETSYLGFKRGIHFWQIEDGSGKKNVLEETLIFDEKEA